MKKILLAGSFLLASLIIRAQVVTTFSNKTTQKGFSSDSTVILNAKYSDPYGAAQDSKGNLWITDAGNNTIVMDYAPTQVYYHRAGDIGGFVNPFQDGCGTSNNSIGNPSGIAVGDSNNIFIVDGNNYAIRKLAPFVTLGACQKMTTLAGGGFDPMGGQPGYQEGVGRNARFASPVDIAVSKDKTFLVVTDWLEKVVRKIDLEVPGKSYGQTELLAGKPGVTDSTNGSLLSSAFYGPWGIFVDQNTGLIYVTDVGASNIRVINTAAGTVSTLVSGIESPTSVVIYGNTAYVASFNKVWAYNMTTKKKSVFVGAVDTASGFKDGTGQAARFYMIAGITLYNQGGTYSLLAVDQGNNNIRQITLPKSSDIQEEEKSLSLHVYPNPVKDDIMIEGDLTGEATVSLCDLTGKEISSSKITFNGAPQRFNLNGAAKGIYILKVVSEKSTATEKVVVGF